MTDDEHRTTSSPNHRPPRLPGVVNKDGLELGKEVQALFRHLALADAGRLDAAERKLMEIDRRIHELQAVRAFLCRTLEDCAAAAVPTRCKAVEALQARDA